MALATSRGTTLVVYFFSFCGMVAFTVAVGMADIWVIMLIAIALGSAC